MAFEDEFLIEAYQDYLNDVEEWPNFGNIPGTEKYIGNDSAPMPLLIRECSRLIPVKNDETGHVDFHPFNMPNTKIGHIQIVGTIIGLTNKEKYKKIEVCDGTGAITVVYKLEDYKADRQKRREINRKYKIAPKDEPSYIHSMRQKIVENDLQHPSIEKKKQFQEANKSWWEECKEGMLGQRLQVGNYVHAYGYCNIKHGHLPEEIEEENFQEFDTMPLMVFHANALECITEKTYNETLEEWVNGIVKCKYTADAEYQTSPEDHKENDS